FRPGELAPRVVEVEDSTTLHGDAWSATAFRVDHLPVDQAFGYRFDGGVNSVVISGDTAPCDNLIRHAQGADLLIHEVLYPGFGIPEYHTLSTDVGKVATRAAVKRLVLTHLIPGDLEDRVWLEDVQRDFEGPITVGHDLLNAL
ncbi:MAG: MBL fold metallo-hydrolase, partial [Thermocrispum sp.]